MCRAGFVLKMGFEELNVTRDCPLSANFPTQVACRHGFGSEATALFNRELGAGASADLRMSQEHRMRLVFGSDVDQVVEMVFF